MNKSHTTSYQPLVSWYKEINSAEALGLSPQIPPDQGSSQARQLTRAYLPLPPHALATVHFAQITRSALLSHLPQAQGIDKEQQEFA